MTRSECLVGMKQSANTNLGRTSWHQLAVDVGTGCVDVLEKQEHFADIVRLMKLVQMGSPDKMCCFGEQRHTKNDSGLEGRNDFGCFRSQLDTYLTGEGRRCFGTMHCNPGHRILCCNDSGSIRVAVKAMILEDWTKSNPIGSHLEGQDRS